MSNPPISLLCPWNGTGLLACKDAECAGHFPKPFSIACDLDNETFINENDHKKGCFYNRYACLSPESLAPNDSPHANMVKIFRKDGELIYRIESVRKLLQIESIPTPKGIQNSRINEYLDIVEKALKKSEPIIDADGKTPFFCEVIHRWEHLPSEVSVSLVTLKDNLAWVVIFGSDDTDYEYIILNYSFSDQRDHIYRERYRERLKFTKACLLFAKATEPSYRCHPETRTYIEKLVEGRLECMENLSKIDRLKRSISIIKTDFVVQKLYNTPRYVSVYIEPKSKISAIDSRLRVSKFTWGICIITRNGSLGRHTYIVIEGIWNELENKAFPFKKNIKEGDYFIGISHFTGASVKMDWIDREKFKSSRRSRVWMVTSNKVKTMWRKIMSERFHNHDFEFDPRGDRAIGSNGHNCFTWARERLKMIDIDLGNSLWEYIFNDPNNFTESPEAHKRHAIKTLI